MLQLNVAEGSPRQTYKVVYVMTCVEERAALFCASHVMSREYRNLALCLICEENRVGGRGGKMGYIYSSSCELLVQHVLFVNKHKTAQPSSCRTTRHLITEEHRNEI